MAIYDGFDESLLEELGSSTRESLEDIGDDYEERDKILNEVDSSGKPSITPRVDYSKFENHVFFGSAYWAINFALARIFDDENGYPWDGELKEKYQWKSLNSNFENWWFENEYPHQTGYLESSISGAVYFKDYENKLVPDSGSFTIEGLVESKRGSLGLNPIFSYGNFTNGIFLYMDGYDLTFGIFSSSVPDSFAVDITDYVDEPFHFAVSKNGDNNEVILYLNGDKYFSSSFSSIGSNVTNSQVFSGSLGHLYAVGTDFFFSGTMQEFRFWKSLRSSDLIKRNYYRSTHANFSGGLKLYYKFSELNDVNPTDTVIDYSGNGLHGSLSGTVVSKTSGTIASWYKTKGDPIFNRANTRVSSSLSKWFTSGSVYDKANSNFIYNLVPSQFIDEPNHDDMQLFLLLVARHYDRLKLYISQLSNYLYSNEEKYNNSPDELLNLLAQNYGLDISGIYDSSNPLSYFFGEEILSSGSIGGSLKEIRNQLRRNLVNNLIYILKSKSTKESLNATFRTLGIDQDIVNINEYSKPSGGIETTYTNKIVERRVANFTTSSTITCNIFSFGSRDKHRTVQARVMFDTGSAYLTSSIFTVQSSSGDPQFYLRAERENLTSSYGTIKLYSSGSSPGFVTSSLLKMYDNEWINFTVFKGETSDPYGFYVTKFFRDDIEYNFSSSTATYTLINDADVLNSLAYFGSSGSHYFEGKMQEIRFWDKILTSSTIIEKHARDFESLELGDFLNEITYNHDDSTGSLRTHLKLNDFTGSGAPAHDYSSNAWHGTLSGFSSSAQFNFPGEYIYKQEQGYSYDFAINNEKIRIRNTNELNDSDLVKDIPYVSIDMSPITALNKEIVKWFGDLEKFNNIIGQPYKKYQTEITDLNSYRTLFFKERLDDRVNYSAYFTLLKWFDSNFSYFIKQLLPLDLANSVSNFAIEPHIFEYNKIEHQFPFNRSGQSRALSGEVSVAPLLTASTTGFELAAADPGRFGAAASASAEISSDYNFNYLLSTGSGVNYNNIKERQILNAYLTGSKGPAEGYGNSYYTKLITGSHYLKNVLNVIEEFRIEDIRYKGDTLSSSYLSSSQGIPCNRHYTGSFPAWQDQRWLWGDNKTVKDENAVDVDAYINPTWDFGIGYGGGIGQLWYFSGKSRDATPWRYGSPFTKPNQASEIGIGHNTTVQLSEITPPVETGQILRNGDKVVSLWPSINDIKGVLVIPAVTGTLSDGSPADGFGDAIEILDYKGLDISISGEVLKEFDNATNLISVIRFQFFNTDQGGSLSYEGSFSASLDTGETRVEKKYLINEYIFENTFGAFEKENAFSVHFQRVLPNIRFMRVYALFKFPGGAGTGDCRISVKGVLTKNSLERPVTKDPVIEAEGGGDSGPGAS